MIKRQKIDHLRKVKGNLINAKNTLPEQMTDVDQDEIARRKNNSISAYSQRKTISLEK